MGDLYLPVPSLLIFNLYCTSGLHAQQLSRLLRNDRAVVGQRVLFFAPSVMKIYILGDVLRILKIFYSPLFLLGVKLF